MVETESLVLRYNTESKKVEVFSKEYGHMIKTDFEDKLLYSFGEIVCSNAKN